MAAAASLSLVACGGETRRGKQPASVTSESETRPLTCPATHPAPAMLPGVTAEHLELSYWLERNRADGHDVDETLLTATDLANLDASYDVERKAFHGQVDLLHRDDPEVIETKVVERRAWLNARFAAGKYVDRDGSHFEPLTAPATTPPIEPVIRVALDEIGFHCAPTDKSFYGPELHLRIDYNACSTARPQEPILVYAAWPGDWLLARTRYTWGYIPADAPLSPPLSPADAERFVSGPFATVVGETPGPDGSGELAAGTRVPLLDGGERIAVATRAGVATADAPENKVRPNARPLTRRALLTEAFRMLGTPYGFGGAKGGRDCSRLLLDIFESFGVSFPRHSIWQKQAGSYRIDVSKMDESTRLRVLDAAHDRGVVVLHLPGHMMLYLGRDHRDRPMVLHALGEYVVPCSGPGSGKENETLFEVDEISVSDLELGRDSSRTAFIERITDVVVLGKPPGPKLAGIAELRPAAPVEKPSPAACKKAGASRVLVSPELPSSQSVMRVVTTQASAPGSVELALFGPDGRHVPAPVTVGGPPFGTIASVDKPAPGTWTAVLGDGARIDACRTFRVTRRQKELDTGAEDGPVWSVRRKWSPATEDLFAVFVERLFDYPSDEDLTWPNLHTLVRDPERNILHGHLGQHEDVALELVPDCADLPYTLRAYFAWKLGLPFGYRQCTRARVGKPPRCEAGATNLVSRAELGYTGDVDVFQHFSHREIRRAAHSSSGRTHPRDSDTDFYPVPLEREALPPGTLFADPYGHLLVVADWIDQGEDGYGILIGAEAQPDGTVGRRRFWRGSFLFIPEADSGGAGFKAFRPWRVEDDGSLSQPDNRALSSRPRQPFSTAQYDGTVEQFYDRMDALINPRPLDAFGAQEVIIDAFEEAVVRRLVSVDNGEVYMREQGYRTMDMPSGASIFRTVGPWEDFATPSRDWRLLVSIYVAFEFPDRVLRSPELFGVSAEDAPEVAAKLRRALDAELANRKFFYTRSDGSTWELSLADVLDRRAAFEMAYNPNDCVEIRWAAPEGSDERATCKRHAPADQRQRMEEYRPWFAERSRPPT